MADGRVTIDVDLNGKKAQGDINGLKSSLGSLGSAFKSVLGANLISGALMSGFSALSGAIKGTFSSAISEGAKLQQSIGGIETLFKDSADTVKNYASQAFQTAGVSANEYMENVTSFSASLIQSLGGDTAQAAELANTAMMDMSDNANKMGSDMKMITQTYQSLARGNYAMLDNLKLGYGGTKAEMQRLIKDASTYKDIQDELGLSVEEGNMSFSNMVKAISVVQKKLGITGTTALEASKTFSGSLNAMRAAFKDFLGNLTTGGDIKKPLENLAKTASTFIFGNLIPMVASAFKALPSAIGTFIAQAKPELDRQLKALLPADVYNNIKNFAKAIGDAFNSFKNTGAIEAVVRAFNAIKDAIGHVFKSLTVNTGAINDLASALGQIVKFLADAATSAAKFISSLPPGTIKAIAGAIGGAVLGFKAFNFLKTFNPFGIFRRNSEEATNGVARNVIQSRGVISQIFSGLANVIKSAGVGIKAAAIGIGVGIKAALSGVSGVVLAFGTALRTAGVANILAFGAAVGIAAVGIGAGVAIIAAGFALLATQGQGVATIITAIGTAFATVGTALIGAFAQAIVLVAGVLPTVTSALALLSPLVVAVGQAVGAAAPAITALGIAFATILSALPPVIEALGTAVAAIATALTPIVEIVGNVFVQVVQIVADAIVQIVQALAPFIPAVTELVTALSPVLQSIVNAFNTLVSQISPIIDSIANLFKTMGEAIKTVLDGAKGVIESFGSAVKSILDGVANIFDSIGNAALNAGKGFNQLATGVVKITNTNLGDMAASLGAVAVGVGKIAGHSAGLAQAGSGMKTLGTGMTTVSTSASTAASGLTSFASRITTLKTTATSLPSTLTTAASGFASFTAQAVAGVAGLSAINAPIAAFKAQIMTITPALLLASASFSSFGTRALVIGAAFTAISALITAFNARVMTISTTVTAAGASFGTLQGRAAAAGASLTSVSSGFNQVSASASSAIGQVNRMASSTHAVVSAFNSMRGQVQSSMQAILSIIRSVGSQMQAQGRVIGQRTASNLAQGILGGVGAAVGAMDALMASVRSAGMAGVGSMVGIGSMIGQGLAQGMYSALGAVTAAANALVAQAERAAQAKAKIHSPSRLFRDNVGRFISQGVAVGILADAYKVDDAMGSMYSQIQAFNFKAEDIIGVGNSKLSKVVQVKSDLESAIKATVEVAKEQSNKLMEKALEVADKAVSRPTEMRLDDGTLVAKTSDKYREYQSFQDRTYNRQHGVNL